MVEKKKLFYNAILHFIMRLRGNFAALKLFSCFSTYCAMGKRRMCCFTAHLVLFFTFCCEAEGKLCSFKANFLEVMGPWSPVLRDWSALATDQNLVHYLFLGPLPVIIIHERRHKFAILVGRILGHKVRAGNELRTALLCQFFLISSLR